MGTTLHAESPFPWDMTEHHVPPKGHSSAELIVRDITRGLFEGRYASGQRLVESELTRRYGVSRGSVREALSHLAADGLVVLERHRGAFLCTIGREQAIENLALLEVLTGLSTRQAAERIHLPGAAEAVRQAAAAVLSFDPHSTAAAYAAARAALFDTLAEIAGSAKLSRLLANLRLCLVRSTSPSVTLDINGARVADFRAITDAVLKGDGERAETAARLHVRRVLESLQSLPDEPDDADRGQAFAPSPIAGRSGRH